MISGTGERENSASAETSIVIRTFNEEKLLPALLESIRGQSYRDFEIVVVDSGSFDRTREIASVHADKLLRINSEDFTFGYSLNVGIEAGVGRYVVNLSAHTKPVNESWLERLLEPLRSDDTAMVYGRQLGVATSKFGETRDLLRTFGPEPKLLKPPHFFANNANSALRKELWREHGFDEALLGLEDIEWAKYWMERGLHVVYEPEAPIFHIHEETWSQVRRRYFREAASARDMGIWGKRHVVSTLFNESRYFVSDFYLAAREGKARRLGKEILRFRYHKTWGTVAGLLDSMSARDPVRRGSVLFDRTFNAVVIQAPGKASLDELQLQVVKPGDVLIEVAYEGVSPTDVRIFEGSQGHDKQRAAEYPIVPGHEVSGRVVRTGPNVSHLSEGDPVTIERMHGCGRCPACLRMSGFGCKQRRELGIAGANGGYGQYVIAQGRFVHKLPPEMDLRHAALCEPLATALKGLRRLGDVLRAGDEPKRCLVVGAGPVGHLSAKVLASWEHEVSVFDQDVRRRSYFDGTSIGVTASLDPLDEYDVIVENTGDPQVLHTILDAAGPGSTILLKDMPHAYKEFGLGSVVSSDQTIVGSFGSEAQDFDKAVSILPVLDFLPFTQRVLPLTEYETAWAETKSRAYLKVLLEIGQPAGLSSGN